MALVACIRPAPAPKPTPTVEAEVDCTQTEPNLIAQGIADRFAVSYDQVMAWACGGETFDDILLALQTSKLANRPAQELLEMKKKLGWDGVWETLGLVSQPAQPNN